MVPVGVVHNVYALVDLLSCKVGGLPMSYLGMPLGPLTSQLLFGILYWRSLKKGWQGGRKFTSPKVVG